MFIFECKDAICKGCGKDLSSCSALSVDFAEARVDDGMLKQDFNVPGQFLALDKPYTGAVCNGCGASTVIWPIIGRD